ncbi:MAG: dockerin type I domain-containing protein [Patescibacteria group bacterium]
MLNILPLIRRVLFCLLFLGLLGFLNRAIVEAVENFYTFGVDARKPYVVAEYHNWYLGPPDYAGDERSKWLSQTAYDPWLSYNLPEYNNGEYGYFSGDPEVIQQHVDWAKWYGIDAFAVNYHFEWNYTETQVLPNWAQITEQKNIPWYFVPEWFAYMCWTDVSGNKDQSCLQSQSGMEDWLVARIEKMNQTHFKKDIYLKYKDRPLIEFWAANHPFYQYDPSMTKSVDLTSFWKNVRSKLKQKGIDIFTICQIEDTEICDLYGTYGLPGDYTVADLTITNEEFEAQALGNTSKIYQRLKSAGIPYAKMVETSFDDRIIRGQNRAYIPITQNLLRKSWELGFGLGDSGTNLVVLASFNEWWESRIAEPCNEYGAMILEELARLISSTCGANCHKYSFQNDPFPSSVQKGKDVVVTFKVKNEGLDDWINEGPFFYDLSVYTGGNKENRVAYALLSKAVEPGETVTLNVTIPGSVFAEEGKVKLTADLVHEGVTWFEWQGSIPLTKEVTIVSSSCSSCPADKPAKSLGNANCDGQVDPLDYSIWAKEYSKIGDVNILRADFNCDGQVSGLDYNVLLRNISWQ